MEIELLKTVNHSPASIFQMVWQILKNLRLSPAIHLSKSISQIVWQILNLVLFMPVNHSPISISQIVWRLLEIGLLGDVKTFYPKSNLISKNVLAKKSLNNDSNRFQAQKARKHAEEYAEKPLLSYPKNANFAASIKTFT